MQVTSQLLYNILLYHSGYKSYFALSFNHQGDLSYWYRVTSVGTNLHTPANFSWNSAQGTVDQSAPESSSISTSTPLILVEAIN